MNKPDEIAAAEPPLDCRVMRMRTTWFFIGVAAYQFAHFLVALSTGKTLTEWVILMRAAVGA